jgi:hypothetical protein
MKERFVRRLGAIVVVMLCLAATTAWAAFEWESYEAYLNGVDQYGHLTSVGGRFTDFVALENTSDGSVIGTARARVWNQSHQFQAYVNANFGYIVCVQPTSSLYSVDPWGNATLTATGFENCIELEM